MVPRKAHLNCTGIFPAVQPMPFLLQWKQIGSVPLGMGLEETEEWIDTQITSNSLYGIQVFSEQEKGPVSPFLFLLSAVSVTGICFPPMPSPLSSYPDLLIQ